MQKQNTNRKNNEVANFAERVLKVEFLVGAESFIFIKYLK